MTIRKFNDDQRLQIAKEVFDGNSRKQVAFKWGISRTCLDDIFYEYIEWRMVWKPEKLRTDIKVDRIYFRAYGTFAVTEDGKEWRLSSDEIKKALNIAAALSQPLAPTNGASPRILGLEHETSNSK